MAARKRPVLQPGEKWNPKKHANQRVRQIGTLERVREGLPKLVHLTTSKERRPFNSRKKSGLPWGGLGYTGTTRGFLLEKGKKLKPAIMGEGPRGQVTNDWVFVDRRKPYRYRKPKK